MSREHNASAYFDTHSLRSDIRGKAVSSGGTMIISRMANTVIQMASTIVLARLLTPEDFGLVTMVTAFSLLLFNVGFNGFTEAIIQKENITPQQVSTVFWIGLALSTTLAILFAASAPLLAWFYREPRVIPITIVMSGGFIFSALATEHLALIMRNMQFHKIMINELASAIISVFIAIWMALKGFGYWAIVARQLTIPVLGAAIAWFQCSWRPRRPVKDPEIRPMVSYALHTFGNFTTTYLGQNLDKILLGWRWGSAELGNYERAYRLSVMPVDQIPVPLGNVALAALSRLRDDPDRFRAYFLKVLSFLSLTGMLLSAVMTVAGPDIILLLLGPQWDKSGQIFMVLGPSIGLAMVYRTHGWLHLSLGNARRWFKWGFVALGLTALSFAVGVFFGAMGIAIAYGSSIVLLTGPGLQYAAKPIGIKLGDIWQVVWRHMAAGLMSGIATWAIFHRLVQVASKSAQLHVAVRTAVTVSVCTGLFLAILTILNGNTKPIREAVRMARHFLPGRRRASSPPDEKGS
jgi:O-antigen/teichoic acid export membrane protein